MFGQQFTGEFQAEFLKRYITCLKNRPAVAGMHIWHFADFSTNQLPLRVQGNRKGIFSRSLIPRTRVDRCTLFSSNTLTA